MYIKKLYSKVFVLSLIFALFSTLTIVYIYAYQLENYAWPKQFNQTYNVDVLLDSGIGSSYQQAWTTSADDWNAAQDKIEYDISVFNFSSNNFVGTIIDPDTSIYGSMTTNYTGTTINYFTAYLNTGNSSIATNNTIKRSTAGHELGHALGLRHSSTIAIMNSSRNRTVVYTPQTDDINGVEARYPF